MQKLQAFVVAVLAFTSVAQASEAPARFQDLPDGLQEAVVLALREPVAELAKNENEIVYWISKRAAMAPTASQSLASIELSEGKVEDLFSARAPQLSNAPEYGANRADQTWGMFLSALGGTVALDRALNEIGLDEGAQREELSRLIRVDAYDPTTQNATVSLPARSRFYCNTELEVYLMDGMFWQTGELTENCD